MIPPFSRLSALSASVLLLLLFATCLSPVGAASAPDTSPGLSTGSNEVLDDDLSPEPTSLQSPYSQSNNTTVDHVDIGGMEDESDTSSTGHVLAQVLGERLTAGSISVSKRQFEIARRQLGPEFNRTLDQYGQFTAGTPGDDDTTAVRFRRTAEMQRELTADVEAYHDTLSTYRSAKRDGHSQEAKKAARQLLRLSRDVNTTGRELQQSYDELSETGVVNLTNASVAVGDVVADVSTSQTSVQNVTLVQTRLRASANRTNVSATQPLVVTGQLQSENGTVLTNRTVRLSGNVTSVRTRTDANGSFRLVYRPLLDPVGPGQVRVEYLPVGTSRFATSNATVDVRVSQVEPELSVDTAPSEVRFNDTLEVSGRLTVADQPAPEVPVILSLGNRTLARVTTDESGRFVSNTSLSPAVPVGEATIRAQLSLEDRALWPVNETSAVTVRRTETSLGATATHVGGRRISVQGSLTTRDGTGVGNQLVVIKLDGVEMDRITTDPSGAYGTTVEIPARFLSANDTSVGVQAAFDASGTNLAGSESRTTVQIPIEDAREGIPGARGWISTQLGNVSIWGIAPILGFAILVVAGVYLRRQGRTETGDTGTVDGAVATSRDAEEDDDEPATPVGPDPSEDASSTAVDGRSREGLALARQKLQQGETDVAVEMAYAALKGYLAAVHGIDRAQPHWEFLTAYETTNGVGTGADAYRWLTEVYERAAFAPQHVSNRLAERYISQVESLLGAEQDRLARGDGGIDETG